MMGHLVATEHQFSEEIAIRQSTEGTNSDSTLSCWRERAGAQRPGEGRMV